MSSSISSFALSNILRQAVSSAQSNLAVDEQEVSSGTLANVGETLGPEAAQDLGLRSQQSLLQTLVNSNSTVSTTLNSTTNTLSAIQTTAQDFLQTLVQSESTPSSANILQSSAQANLQDLIGKLNSNVDGQFIFGGTNSSVPPIQPFAPGSSSETPFDSAFAATFGTTQADPNLASATPAQMQDFFTTIAPQFQDPDWTTNWSVASDVTNVSQISPSQTVTTSVSANNPAFQQLAQAYAIVSDVGLGNLNSSTYSTVVSQAVSLVQSAISGLTDIQANLGTAQSQISDANNFMSTQLATLSTQIGAFENVDTFAVSTQATDLQTQIETAFSLTSQLQQLSLVKFL